MTTDPNAPGGRETPMGAHPPESPRIDEILAQAFRDVEPAGFRDHPESAMEAADMDVEDSIGAE